MRISLSAPRRLWASRRQVLIHWLILTLALLLLTGFIGGAIYAANIPIHWLNTHHKDPLFKVWLNEDGRLNYHELMAIAERLDRIWDDIERQDPDWAPPVTATNKKWWMAETSPMFNYEGISRYLVYPVVLNLIAQNGMEHNHVGGRSNCNDALGLNYRYGNKLSTWSERSGWLAVLTHEIAHNHQGPYLCGSADRELLENSAQLSSWEVLAALANQGNKLALFSLVGELRGVFINAAEAQAIRLGGRYFADFEKRYRAIIGDDLLRWSSYEKSKRYWAQDRERLAWILETYSEEPAQLLGRYLASGEIPGLALANRWRSLQVDDLIYTLANLEELVEVQLAGLQSEL